MFQTPLSVLILAAGQGKRMGNPDIPKVMVELCGKPLVGHVLDQVQTLNSQATVLIVGHHRKVVIDYAEREYPFCTFAVQEQQLGTGHAVQQAEQQLENVNGNVLILSGDVPLLRSSTLHEFVMSHISSQSILSVLSCIAPDPNGYGRIVRNIDGEFEKIVEHKDASESEKQISEINSGVYIVNKSDLFSALRHVENNNAQGEFYLTDIVEILKTHSKRISAFIAPDFTELQGINRPEELEQAERTFSDLLQ